jgi:hypothetical protein
MEVTRVSESAARSTSAIGDNRVVLRREATKVLLVEHKRRHGFAPRAGVS